MPGAGHADPVTDRQHQLATAWQELEGVIERFNAVRDDLRTTDAQLERVTARTGPLQARVDAAQRDTDEVAAALYRSGAVTSTAVLISAPSPASFMDQLATLDHLQRRRTDALRRLKADRDTLTKEHDELDGLKIRQRTQQQELGQRKATIEAQIKRLGGDRAARGARSPPVRCTTVTCRSSPTTPRVARCAMPSPSSARCTGGAPTGPTRSTAPG
ncbi:coiled-coil domain-containing protein [Dactylosporangium cerinum]